MHIELNKIQSVFVKQHNGRLLIKFLKECIYKLNN